MRAILAAAAAALACAFVLACSTEVTYRLGDDVPTFGGEVIEVTITYDADSKDIVFPDDPEHNGTCVKVTFVDGDGGEISSAETEIGGDPVPVPPGAEGVVCSPCDPPTAPKSDKARRADAVGQLVAARRHSFLAVPIETGDGFMRYVEYDVLAPDAQTAHAVGLAFLRAGTSAPPDLRVTTHGFHETRVLGDGSALLSLVTQDAPQAMRLTIDEVQVASLTSSGVSTRTENGWWRTDVVLPDSYVEVPGTTTVDFEIRTALRAITGAAAITTSL
jgi:hypothetical protein